MSAWNTEASSSTNVAAAPVTRRSSRARRRNAAIWPRVTASSGQNRSLVGGLHPRVTPVAANHSMSAWNTEASSSTNEPVGGSEPAGMSAANRSDRQASASRSYTPNPAPNSQ